MKKLVSLILAVLMLACLFTGCANNDPARIVRSIKTE